MHCVLSQTAQTQGTFSLFPTNEKIKNMLENWQIWFVFQLWLSTSSTGFRKLRECIQATAQRIITFNISTSLQQQINLILASNFLQFTIQPASSRSETVAELLPSMSNSLAFLHLYNNKSTSSLAFDVLEHTIFPCSGLISYDQTIFKTKLRSFPEGSGVTQRQEEFVLGQKIPIIGNVIKCLL